MQIKEINTVCCWNNFFKLLFFHASYICMYDIITAIFAIKINENSKILIYRKIQISVIIRQIVSVKFHCYLTSVRVDNSSVRVNISGTLMLLVVQYHLHFFDKTFSQRQYILIQILKQSYLKDKTIAVILSKISGEK